MKDLWKDISFFPESSSCTIIRIQKIELLSHTTIHILTMMLLDCHWNPLNSNHGLKYNVPDKSVIDVLQETS